MCIVIDTDSMSFVFNEANKNHLDFKPVRDWIITGKGKMVFGGTTYLYELKKVERMEGYIDVILELKTRNKFVRLNKEEAEIDKKEAEFKEIEKSSKFNDPHIVAIVAVSGVKLVCTHDKELMLFLKNKRFYEKGLTPKIYSSKRNADLLCDENIAKCCK